MSRGRPPRGDGSRAAIWANQQNIGETGQDREDWLNGVRCRLHYGPGNGRAIGRRAEGSLAPGGRGYAPEFIKFRPRQTEPGTTYYYKWELRDSDGVHWYSPAYRLVFHDGSSRREVPARFNSGPLRGQERWVEQSGSDIPEIALVQGGVHYRLARSASPSGNYAYGSFQYEGRVRCILTGYPYGESRQEAWAQPWAQPRGERGYAPTNVAIPAEPGFRAVFRYERRFGDLFRYKYDRTEEIPPPPEIWEH